MHTSIAQQDSTETVKPKLEISGSVDVYYRANLEGTFDIAPQTSFANLPGFSLGMANVIVAQEGETFGFRADAVFGPRGEDATFLSSALRPGGSSNIINQLYTYWKVSDRLTLTLGNFNTFLGYEVISPVDNFNYSTSYMFSYGPFSHTGIKADIDLSGGFSLMAGVFNPTDATEYNPLNDYAGGLQLAYSGGGATVALNALVSEDFYQLDITAGYDVTEKVFVGLNATTASDSFSGVAAYCQVAVSDALNLGVRAERFNDNGLGLIGDDEHITDVTVSANYTIGNLTLIPEIRLDSYTKDIFMDNGETMNSLSSVLLAAVYSF